MDFFDLLPALWKFLNASIAGAKQKQKKIMRTVGTGKEINIRFCLNYSLTRYWSFIFLKDHRA
jgi:hypothetical protein